MKENNQKSSKGKVFIFIILIVVIAIVVVLKFDLIKTSVKLEDSSNDSELYISNLNANVVDNEDITKPLEFITNDEDENEINNTNLQNGNTQVEQTDEKNQSTLEIDEEALKNEIKMYALGIGRFEHIINTKEENTILLIMIANELEAKRVVYGNNNNIGKYTTTRDSVHEFIKELTGNVVDNPLESYTNYIGFSEASNSYHWGNSGNPFSSEKYEVLTCEFYENNNSGIRVSGLIEKTLNDERYVYHYNATIVKNNEYTYVPYQIKTFTYSISSNNIIDNVFRLIDKKADENK